MEPTTPTLRVVGSTPKGRTFVAVAEVLDEQEARLTIPASDTWRADTAHAITERLFSDGLIVPAPAPAPLEANADAVSTPTPADDLAELRAYAEKGPAVSRATCGRVAALVDALRSGAVDLLSYWDTGHPPVPEGLDELRRCLEAIAQACVPTETHPAQQRVWVDGVIIDAVVIYREWQRYQRNAMARHPEDQPLTPTPAPAPLWEGPADVIALASEDPEIGMALTLDPPSTHVLVTRGATADPPRFDPDGFDADALVVILGLADLEPLVVHDGAPPVRCALCGAEAPGGATTLAVTQHRGDCLWVSARELAEVVRGGPKTP